MKTLFHWEPGFDRYLLLKKLSACRSVNGGQCSFNAIEYHYWLPVLTSAIRTHKSVRPLKAECIRRAVSNAALKLSDPDKFLERCHLEFKKIHGPPIENYVILFDVTYIGPPLITALPDKDIRICWQPQSSNRFYRRAITARKAVSSLLRARGVPSHIEGLTTLLVHVSAHNITYAHEQAIDAVDRFRGVLNLFANLGRSISPFSGLSNPHAVNRVRLGPYQTIHKPDGSLAAEIDLTGILDRAD